MSEFENNEMLPHKPHLIVGLEEQLFGLEIDHIQEILSLPKTVPIPNSPPFLRGAINLRGKVVPVLDLKQRLGMSSKESIALQMVEMLYKREQDHLNWVSALEKSLRHGDAFLLARDHHMCAFGKWFYSYKPFHAEFAQVLAEIEAPHARLHKMANELLIMADNGDREGALIQLSMLRKSELKLLRDRFEELRTIARTWQLEQVVILKKDEIQLGLCVDTVETTEILDPNSLAELAYGDLKKSGLIARSARNEAGDLVLLLDVNPLLSE